MAELTQEMMDIVEDLKIDEDLKQDLYLEILESDREPKDFSSKKHLKAYVLSYYGYLRANRQKVEANRRRILAENEETVRDTYTGNSNEADDPYDILAAADGVEDRLDGLSPLLRTTLESVVLDGRTPEEVAAVEGTTANVIYKRIHDAKRILQGS